MHYYECGTVNTRQLTKDRDDATLLIWFMFAVCLCVCVCVWGCAVCCLFDVLNDTCMLLLSEMSFKTRISANINSKHVRGYRGGATDRRIAIEFFVTVTGWQSEPFCYNGCFLLNMSPPPAPGEIGESNLNSSKSHGLEQCLLSHPPPGPGGGT